LYFQNTKSIVIRAPGKEGVNTEQIFPDREDGKRNVKETLLFQGVICGAEGGLNFRGKGVRIDIRVPKRRREGGKKTRYLYEPKRKWGWLSVVKKAPDPFAQKKGLRTS